MTYCANQGDYKEFMDAIKKGRAEGLNKVSNALFEKATQGNVTVMIYYLKVRDRANWGENQPEALRQIPAVQINFIESRERVPFNRYRLFRSLWPHSLTEITISVTLPLSLVNGYEFNCK